MTYEHYSDDDLIEAFHHEVQLPVNQQQQEGSVVLEVMYRSYIEISSAVYNAMNLQYNRMHINWVLSVPGIHDVQQMYEVDPNNLWVDVYMRMRRHLLPFNRQAFLDKFSNRPDRFFAYVKMAIYSVVMDYLRNGPPPAHAELPEDLPDPDFDDPLHRSQMQSCAEQLLAQCTPEERRLITLRVLLGLPPREIRKLPEFEHLSAEEIGRRLKALYTRLSRRGNIDPECFNLL